MLSCPEPCAASGMIASKATSAAYILKASDLKEPIKAQLDEVPLKAMRLQLSGDFDKDVTLSPGQSNERVPQRTRGLAKS